MFKKIIFLFLFSWSSLTFFASGIVESQDGLQYLTIARQIYYWRTFEMPEAKYPFGNIHMNTQIGRNGKEFSPTGLGYSLSFLPAVLIEDIFNRMAGVSPTKNFPLSNDWPIMLFGSMTNTFFGALFITTFFLFLKSFSMRDRDAILLSLVLFCSSNLFVYAKHGFAHMMFVCFMWLSFFCLRMYGINKNIFFLIGSGVSFGILTLSYNPTFILVPPALIVYYLLSVKLEKNWKKFHFWKRILRDFIVMFISLIPFLMLYGWFNEVRYGGVTSTGYGSGSFISLPEVKPFVLYEGIWGLLFSPGKSLFLFTPPLLLILVFWQKLKKSYFPEIFTGATLGAIFLFFIGSLVGGLDYFPWHGEASFGPRYLLPVLPFGLLLVGLIYRQLKKYQRILIFVPLVSIGLLIQTVGILIPYQVRFSGLTYEINLNGHRITYDTYANLIPRFSPLYSMTKWFAKKIVAIPSYYFFSPPVRLSDGVHGVLQTADSKMRQIEKNALITLESGATGKSIELDIINFVSSASTEQKSYPLVLKSVHKNVTVSEILIAPGEKQTLAFQLPASQQSQFVELQSTYKGTNSATLSNQYSFVHQLRVGGVLIPLEHFSYPYVSPVSKELFGTEYSFWGKENNKLWDLWNMRSVIYVQTLDLWWLRPFHYWDLPKMFYLVLFLGNATICIMSFAMLSKELKNQPKDA